MNARREGDKNPYSTAVAETMKLLANSSYGYQTLDRSRHTVTKYLNDEKTHSAKKPNVQAFESHKRHFIRTGNGQSRSRTQRSKYCWLFLFTVRQTENAGTIIKSLLRVL